MKRGTKKLFREYLNVRFPVENGLWQNGIYSARKRPYGDYLYHQDRSMFDDYLRLALLGDPMFPEFNSKEKGGTK